MISARHAGVVVGLLALTPVFTHDIAVQQKDAINAGTAVILDSPIRPVLKLSLAKKISEHLESEDGKVPNLGHVFDPLPESEPEHSEVVELREELQDQLDRGATHAFSLSFGIAALIGLLALFPIGLARRLDL